MLNLVLAAVFFAGLHLLVSGTVVRTRLVAALGVNVYRGLFSLASAGGLAWLIAAYGHLRQPEPTALAGYRGVADALVFVAFQFVVLGLLARSPTIVGGERLLEQPDSARGIHRITRHPFLWGVALWAAVHMVYNPTSAHLIFFGTFLVVAVAGTASIDAKRARDYGEAWRRYAALTSNVPFAAIVRGRNRLVWGELGLAKIAAATAAFAAFAWLHGRFFGMPAI